MKKVLLSATVLAFICFPFALMAQEEKKADKETEEVIIRKNGDREMNIKVEINGDKVIVNGKPLAEFKDDQITINKRKMIIRDGDRSMMFDMGPGSKSFSLGDGFMENFGDDDESSSAFLGVTTDKTKPLCKLKAFEAITRATQLGGEEAKTILISRTDEPDNLQRDVEKYIGTLVPNFRAFGETQLKDKSIFPAIINYIKE